MRGIVGVGTGAVVAMLVTACGPPPEALVTRCTNRPLETGDAHGCEVSAGRLDEEQTASFRLTPGYSRVDVTFDLLVAAGRATVAFDSLPGRTWTVGPGAPARAAVVVPLDRGLGGVLLRVRPEGGAVERLTGALAYRGLAAE